MCVCKRSYPLACHLGCHHLSPRGICFKNNILSLDVGPAQRLCSFIICYRPEWLALDYYVSWEIRFVQAHAGSTGGPRSRGNHVSCSGGLISFWATLREEAVFMRSQLPLADDGRDREGEPGNHNAASGTHWEGQEADKCKCSWRFNGQTINFSCC